MEFVVNVRDKIATVKDYGISIYSFRTMFELIEFMFLSDNKKKEKRKKKKSLRLGTCVSKFWVRID